MSFLEERLKRQMQKGDVIFRDGESGQSMFIVLEGQVEISKILGEHKMVLANLGPGSILGEMAVIDNQPRSATATATNSGMLIEISRELFRSRLGEVPQWLQTFFVIIVERLRTATRNQSILMAGGAGRQIVNLLLLLVTQEKEEDQEKILLPWKKSVSTIAFFLGLNEEIVNDLLNKLVTLKVAKSEQREGIGRVFLVPEPEKFAQLGRYGYDRHKVESGHAKAMAGEFQFPDPLEPELLQVLEEITQAEGALEDFPAATLEKHLQERFDRSLSVYQTLLESYRQEGILDSFHPEGSEPAYRIGNRDQFTEKFDKLKLLVEMENLDKQIMG